MDFAERYSFRLSTCNYGTVTLNSGRKPTWHFSVSGHVSFLTSNSLLLSLLQFLILRVIIVRFVVLRSSMKAYKRGYS